jgi:hypothetical protein
MYGKIYLPEKIFTLKDDDPVKMVKIAHERVHSIRQGGFFSCTFWLAKYVISKSFRRQEEAIAFAKEIKAVLNLGLSPNYDGYRKSMVVDYIGTFSQADAEAVITAAQSGAPLYGIDWVEL